MDIKFKTFYAKEVTKEITGEFLNNRLYVPGWSFADWWRNPKRNFDGEGAYFSVFYADAKPAGLAVINTSRYILRHFGYYELRPDIIGFMGYFISRKFRGNGITYHLAQNIEEMVLKNESEKNPKVVSGDNGIIVGRKALKTIKVVGIYSGEKLTKKKLIKDRVALTLG